MKSKKTVVAVTIGCIALCMLLIGMNQQSKAFSLRGTLCKTPEEAFQSEFSVIPNLTIPCEDHMHVIGDVQRHSYDSKKTTISAVALQTDSGLWYLSEVQERAPIIKSSPDPWSTEWSVLFMLQPGQCHRSVIGISIVLRDELHDDQVSQLVNRVTDTAGTQFFVCGEYHQDMGQGLYTIYGLADTRQAGYEVLYNNQSIYP